jgi:hypothetical protein
MFHNNSVTVGYYMVIKFESEFEDSLLDEGVLVVGIEPLAL